MLAWSEGVHLRQEYLRARNLAIQTLVTYTDVVAVVGETNFSLALTADAYLRGQGGPEPSDLAVAGVWSWTRSALRANRDLLRWLRRVNDSRPPERQVRFYGLDMFAGQSDTWVEPHTDDAAALAYARRLELRRREHVLRGGDHRDLEVRDAVQHEVLSWVADRHASGLLVVFEQVEHLDPEVPSSLGSRMRAAGPGPCATVGAVWSTSDLTVSYPLGRYEQLSRWCDDLVGDPSCSSPVGHLVRLRDDRTSTRLAPASGSFDAVLWTPQLTWARA